MQPSLTIESNAGLTLTCNGRFDTDIIEHIQVLFDILVEDYNNFLAITEQEPEQVNI